MVLKGKDKDWYSCDETCDDFPTDVMTFKVEPEMKVTVEPGERVFAGEEIVVKVEMANHFNHSEGLPTADEMVIDVQNAVPKSKTVQNGHVYTATFMAEQGGDSVSISANVSDKDANDHALSIPIREELTIMAESNITLPQTGDPGIALWAALAIASGALGLVRRRRPSANRPAAMLRGGCLYPCHRPIFSTYSSRHQSL